jgi:hypothetical protein
MSQSLALPDAAATHLLPVRCARTHHRPQANMAAVRVLPTRSAAVRSYTESHLLEDLSGRLSTVALSGFMFFGSSVLMSDSVSVAERCAVSRLDAGWQTWLAGSLQHLLLQQGADASHSCCATPLLRAGYWVGARHDRADAPGQRQLQQQQRPRQAAGRGCW